MYIYGERREADDNFPKGKTYRISKLVQFPTLSGIVPVRLLPLTSLKTIHEAFSFRLNKNVKSKENNAKGIQDKIMNTHKYHRPVN